MTYQTSAYSHNWATSDYRATLRPKRLAVLRTLEHKSIWDIVFWGLYWGPSEIGKLPYRDR